jgi:hypothetical protein
MSWRSVLLLGGLGLVVYLLVGAFQHTPGYMDAEYYYAGGLRLAQGSGFSEEFIWNYLDDPQALPHPSHTYWMPLASLAAALGILISGSVEFQAGRWVFLAAAAGVPVVTALLAYRYIPRRSAAYLAGLLGIFSSFYLPYLPTSDTFALVMILGAIWLLAAHQPIYLSKQLSVDLSPLLLGVLSGLLHLARADGIVWLAAALIAAIWLPVEPARRGARLTRVIAVLLGYFVVMAPWFLRSLYLFGSPLPPGGSKALWFIDYNDLYAFPAQQITPQRWWASGIEHIVRARLWSLGQNLQTLLAVQASIFLAPLMIVGLWRLRRERSVRLGALIWMMIFLLMTLTFPFAGARGGYFHSGAGLQPLLWASVPAGLDVLVTWGSRQRGWQADQAWRIFAGGIIVLSLGISFFVANNRISGGDWRKSAWDSPSNSYSKLAQELAQVGITADAVVMVNNPPGYYLASGQRAIAIPDGGVDELLAAAHHFRAGFVLLEANHPEGLSSLYDYPTSQPGLSYTASLNGTHVFSVEVSN